MRQEDARIYADGLSRPQSHTIHEDQIGRHKRGCSRSLKRTRIVRSPACRIVSRASISGAAKYREQAPRIDQAVQFQRRSSSIAAFWENCHNARWLRSNPKSRSFAARQQTITEFIMRAIVRRQFGGPEVLEVRELV